MPENNVPAAGSHVLTRAEDVHHMDIPPLDAGWYGKLAEWTAIWKENLLKPEPNITLSRIFKSAASLWF